MEHLIGSSAEHIGATVGLLRRDGSGLARNLHGRPQPVDPPASAVPHPVPGRDETVWLDAADLSAESADHFLDRLAVAASVVERWGHVEESSAPTPASVIIDETSSSIARERARNRLGLAAARAIRIFVCSGPDDAVEETVHLIEERYNLVGRTSRGDRTILLVGADDAVAPHLPGVPTGVRIAFSRALPAERADEAYRNAFDAHLYTGPSPHDLGPYQPISGVMIDGARLNGLGALCRLRREDLEAVPEMGVLDSLAQQHGDQILRVVEAYAVTGSLRNAATQLFMHHNTVAYWVQKAETALGYSLSEPSRRAQFFITACLHRLWREDDRQSLVASVRR